MSVKSCISLCLLLQCAAIFAAPDLCYFCNTEVHGQGCNDPIEPNTIQQQRCSNSDIVRTITQISDTEISQDSNVYEVARSKRDTNEHVCVYLTYRFNSRNVSARGCETEFIDTPIGRLDICNYYTLLLPARISNFNCTVCSDNLCNHVNYSPIPKPSGASAISMSVALITSAILLKTLFV